MPRSRTVAFFNFALFVATALAFGAISAFAQGKAADTAVIRLAYTQVFTDPQDFDLPESEASQSQDVERIQVALGVLEHDPEKWKPVFRKDHAQTKG